MNPMGIREWTYERTATLWLAFLGKTITAEDVPLMMILLKVSREANKHKRDNLVDIAGYARTREMLDDKPDAKKKNASRR